MVIRTDNHSGTPMAGGAGAAPYLHSGGVATYVKVEDSGQPFIPAITYRDGDY